MKMTLKSFKRSAEFNWKIAFSMTAYFLILALLNMLFKSDLPFKILAWPLYVFPKQKALAAILEMFFAYFVSIFLTMLFDSLVEHKTANIASTKSTSEKES